MQKSVLVSIQNMTCGGCAARVARALEGVSGVQDVAVNLADETARFSIEIDQPVTKPMQALDAAGYPARSQDLRFRISGLSCASCVGRLQNAFNDVPGVVSAHVNLADESATLQFIPGLTTPQALAEIAMQTGFPATIADEVQPQDRAAEKQEEADHHRRMMWISAALTLPVFLLEMGGHLLPAWHHLIGRTIGHQASWVIQFVLTTAVLFGPGRQFFTKGLPALWHRSPNMNSLVALGAGSAWAFSTVALLAPGVLPEGTRAVYFEAAAVIVTLILLGRWFEARAKGQTGAAIQSLIGLQPRTALVAQGDDWNEVSVNDLRVGDKFMLKPGERVPTDASVIDGNSFVDESMLTGEPMQVAKVTGDTLTGGTVNGHGSLVCEVLRVGHDTTLSQIIAMVQQAQSARLPIQALVDRVTLWFVPAVMGIAILTVVTWLIFGPDPALSYALVSGVSVLIIACPCAMGLATPTSIMVGSGRAAELGVLFRQGDALQTMCDVKVIALDKTGTLTMGKPMLTDIESVDPATEDHFLAQVAAVEARSEHPIAQAILQAARDRGLDLPEVTSLEVISGQGITGIIDGQRIAVGNRSMMQQYGSAENSFLTVAEEHSAKGKSVFFASIDGRVAAVFAVSDPLRPTSAAAISALKARGLRVAMISGDGRATAQTVADGLGIETVIAEVMPEGKIDALKSLRTSYGSVAFVGDGINDAPVLAEADVGIAIGTGTDVAIETADVVLMGGDVMGVVHAFDLSRQTLRNIKQNLFWAFGYNAALIPVAAGVLYPALGMLLSPGLAAGAMAFSSVFVLGNALRLRRVGIAP
ncbi:heavy metal translocating P-type ATPase [Sulfitobacter sp. F26204]|uniref:heavy metal translocating P-type ATPase n=1 Tax=Sulfitobacter sp. F26204 TaxID=2996014 RepID=UPI00225E5EAC|nr:heavy metal translocating P-type ATPase [Sulfitobacter sp. F26204]MCX7558185.1 heavy metal translocating P-type ATPase [Sulfitobacter sp. F26204]